MKLAIDPALHPSRKTLAAFQRGEIPRAQAAEVVRHLLRGCPQCSLLAGWVWELGAALRSKKFRATRVRTSGAGAVPIEGHRKRRLRMSQQLQDARVQVMSIVQQLHAIKYRLVGVYASLPAGIEELDRLVETDQPDDATELRTLVACVLSDYVEPAHEALRKGTFEQLFRTHAAAIEKRQTGAGEE